MVRSILTIGEDKLAVDDVGIVQHILLLGYQFLPVVDARAVNVGCHDAVAGSTVISKQVNLFALRIKRCITIVHIGSHLDEL